MPGPLALTPALVRVLRGTDGLQIGLDPERAVLLHGLSAPVRAALRRSEPGSDLGTSLVAAGAAAEERQRLVELLLRSGALVEAEPRPPRLAPDAASAGLLRRAPGDGPAVVAARARSVVQVVGGGRVGTGVAALLASAGVGTVLVDDEAAMRPVDLSPGTTPDDVGSRRGPVAERVARSCAAVPPDPAGSHDTSTGPDLVVVAPATGLGRDAAHAALRAGVPHLMALVVETLGVVGPLVHPGRTSCVRCHDLTRTDRDPGWPAVLAACADAPQAAACDATLAGLVAAQAALQVVACLDGWTPAAVDATLETALPAGLTRRRSWRPHPACGCGWDSAP